MKDATATRPRFVPQQPAKRASTETFAANLLVLMEPRGMMADPRRKPPEMLADALGLDKVRVRAWLSGICYPNQDILVKICNFFHYYDIYALITRPVDRQEALRAARAAKAAAALAAASAE